ncbi:MAG: hypothetical protein ACOCVQ_02670, partial [Bacillota bacterium]
AGAGRWCEVLEAEPDAALALRPYVGALFPPDKLDEVAEELKRMGREKESRAIRTFSTALKPEEE